MGETRHKPTKQTPKTTQSWSNHYWNPITNVSVKVQYEKITKTWNIAEKTHSNNGRNYTHQYREVKGSCNQFPSFMSEPYLSTKSKTCVHLKKLKILSSLRRPETHMRHAQGHHQAGALTGSINIFQSTNITVYEVEYQNTNNTKLGKQNIWFSEVIKDIYHYFPKKQARRQKETAGKVALLF